MTGGLVYLLASMLMSMCVCSVILFISMNYMIVSCYLHGQGIERWFIEFCY